MLKKKNQNKEIVFFCQKKFFYSFDALTNPKSWVVSKYNDNA